MTSADYVVGYMYPEFLKCSGKSRFLENFGRSKKFGKLQVPKKKANYDIGRRTFERKSGSFSFTII